MINILVLIIFFFSRTNIVTLGSKIQKTMQLFSNCMILQRDILLTVRELCIFYQ